MLKDKLLIAEERFLETVSSTKFRLLLLSFGFVSLILIRQILGTFGISLGYLYVALISLAGLWFGIVGGLVAAIVACSIFLIEVHIFRGWTFRDLVVQSIFLRLLVYFLAGLILGYLCDIEKRLKQRLRTLAYHDELTDCVNFRWAMQLLEQEIERSKRYFKEMTIIMIDIDHFKKLNDSFGHLVGNNILKAFADTIKSKVRHVDTVCRYGGEEFLVILPEANSDQALIVVERIRSHLSGAKINLPRLKVKEKLSIQFSAGVASFPRNGEHLEDLISVADNALYRAKRAGRDRAIIEQRRWIRVKPQADLRIELIEPSKTEGLEACEITNISQRGMLLLFPKAIPTGGEDFLCRLHLPEERLPSEFNCKVVHRKKSEKNIYQVGVFFVDIPPDTEKTLLRYVKTVGHFIHHI